MGNRNARNLRTNMTDAERALWHRIRHKQIDPHRFRQVPISPYIVDFAWLDAKLIVEVDGGQHSDASEEDHVRDAWLRARGYRVVRFWNNEVLANLDGVLATISDALRETPHPNPPPQGGRE